MIITRNTAPGYVFLVMLTILSFFYKGSAAPVVAAPIEPSAVEPAPAKVQSYPYFRTLNDGEIEEDSISPYNFRYKDETMPEDVDIVVLLDGDGDPLIKGSCHFIGYYDESGMLVGLLYQNTMDRVGCDNAENVPGIFAPP